jgi:2,2-dialkylglycine decarboxylase (pyruvate)
VAGANNPAHALSDIMNDPNQALSLSAWQRQGENVLVLQPFMDSVIVGGDGCFLIDADGRRILDLAAGQFCTILGHNHPKFVARLQEQAAKLVHLGDQYVSPEVMSAMSRLAAIAPGELNKVVLLSTGSEANECAMRIAKAVTGRTGMLGFTRGYYGISLATHNLSSISDHPGKHDFQPAPINQFKLLTPTCDRCPIQKQYPSCNIACLDVSLDLIAHQLENIAAVIVEPIVSAGGMIIPPKDYLQKVYEATRKLGILFIADEAQTGLGRCGQWFDIQNYDIQPDILVVSKTVGNGYPAAAVVVSDSIARSLEARHFMHLSSHQNDPLAAAAVMAVIDIVEEVNLIEHSRNMGEYFMTSLRKLQQKHSIIADVRGRGLMIGIELSPDSDEAGDAAFKAALLCERRGLHITFSYFEPVLRIIPPLIITNSEIDLAVSILDDALTELETGNVRLTDIIPQNCRSSDFIKGMVKTSGAAFLRKVWRTSPQQWLNKVRSMRENG